MGHWRQPVLLFILPKKPQEMNDFSSFLAVFFYGLMSQSLLLILLLLNAWFVVFLNTRRCSVEGTFGFTCLF